MSEESVAFSAGDAVVVRTKDEGCDVCGGEPIGILFPKERDPSGAYRDGILICEDCYVAEDHYDDDDQFGYKEFADD